MQLLINTVLVTVSDDQIRTMLLERLLTGQSNTEIIPENAISLPQIGEYWPGQGGIFTGLLPARDGIGFDAVISGPMFNDAGKYEDMKAKVEAVEVDGHKDFRLPYRNEQALQYATLKDKFSKEDWYWSNERHPANEDYAYAQHFGDGEQGGFDTDYTCFACAVRIVSIR